MQISVSDQNIKMHGVMSGESLQYVRCKYQRIEYQLRTLNGLPRKYHAQRAYHVHRKPQQKLADRRGRCPSSATLASFDSMQSESPDKRETTHAGKHPAQKWRGSWALWVGSICIEENHHRAQHQRPKKRHMLRRHLLPPSLSIQARGGGG